ncbi:MAG: hypothetical protein AAFX87_08275 [Bacteroidota bacterium]
MLTGCTDEIGRNISGTYEVSGTEIRTVFPCHPCTLGQEPTIDTLILQFSLKVKLKGDDVITFEQLPSAEFVHENAPACNMDSSCELTGTMDGNDFTIGTDSSGGNYNASGSIVNGQLQMTGQYHYRNRTFVYSFEGNKN